MEGKESNHSQGQLRSLMTAKDVAEILGISAKTVNRLARERKLGCVQVTGKERRFTEEQVREYIEAQSRRPEEVRIDTSRVRRSIILPEERRREIVWGF